MEVTARIFELGKGGSLLPVSTEGMTELKPGTQLHWGGAYEHDSVIISKKSDSFGVKYLTLNPDDEALRSHYVEAYQIKRKDDPALWHTQHYYLTGKFIDKSEVEQMFQKSEALRIERVSQNKVADVVRQEKIDKGKKLYDNLKPVTAKAIIIAEYEIDDCDSMTDYYNTKTGDQMILAWSNHTRDIFSEMRKAAAKFTETKHLATATDVNRNGEKLTESNKSWWHPADEHREKYSMGAGYYLKSSHRYSSGWTVNKMTLGHYMESIYILLADGKHKLQEVETKPIKPGITANEEKNGIEIRFPEKPDVLILNKLKSAGWRWSRFSHCWYNQNNTENMTFASSII